MIVAETMVAMLLENGASYPNKPALVHKVGDRFVTLTWGDYANLVEKAARGFLALGQKVGNIITIVSGNRVEWVVSHVAAMTLRGAGAGIYQTNTAPQVAYIVRHAESPICVVENLSQLAKLEAERATLPKLQWAVLLEGEVPSGLSSWVVSFADLLKRGEAISRESWLELAQAVTPEDLATLIYTSGTTGEPKGVMLTHGNLVFTARSVLSCVPKLEEYIEVSYLPLSHIAEQLLTVTAGLVKCGTIYFAESLDKLRDTLTEARPTVFFGVPRVWEKLEAGLQVKLREEKGPKGLLIKLGLSANREFGACVDARKPVGPFLAARRRVLNKLVFDKLKVKMGFDRAVILVSAAAPISRSTLEFFRSLDMTICEVYGQSEDCGPTSINPPDGIRLGTVGKPLPGVDVKIASDGEILVRGKNVFQGYFKNPEATRETLVDGWLCSGDVGELDSDGYLRITDRKKDLLITAGGKNVAPQPIEGLLKSIPEVAQAVVIGDRRKYLSALLTLDPQAAASWCEERGRTFESSAGLIQDSAFLEHIQKKVDEINQQLARYEQIKKFEILPQEFSVDGGELTPTLKIKRKVVNEKYRAVIEALNADSSSAL